MSAFWFPNSACYFMLSLFMTGKAQFRSIFFAIALAAAGIDSAEMPSLGVARRTITVAFWNIQWFPGGHPNPSGSDEIRQTGFVHADIARIDPDVIGLEEVRDFKSATVAVQEIRSRDHAPQFDRQWIRLVLARYLAADTYHPASREGFYLRLL